MLVAKSLDAACNRLAFFVGVDVADARLIHVRGKRPALVFAGRWLRFSAVLRETYVQRCPGFRIALIKVTTVRDAGIPQLRGDRFAFVITGRWLRIFALLREALGVCFPSELCASGFIATYLEAV